MLLQLPLRPRPCAYVWHALTLLSLQGHGDVALSVLMTTASTLGAIIMTPTLTSLLAGTLVPVDAMVRHTSGLQATCPVALCIAVSTHAENLMPCLHVLLHAAVEDWACKQTFQCYKVLRHNQ